MAEADTTLRDFQHAHRFYTTSNFAHAPKTKFLYHVLFTLTDEALAWSYAMQNFGKEISVLVKAADLPSFSASIETKKQYNRVKHFQTKVDYDSVSIAFHDDNLSITSQLLEDYYTYYFRDGLKRNDTGGVKDYDPRDKLGTYVPHYGLENRNKPFFKHIKIFQLSRQSWRSYTLINPLLEKWQHDSLAAAEGAGIMENSISLVYEGVLYNEGNITENSDPAGFASQESNYDFTQSPLYGVITGQPAIKGKTPLSRVPIEATPQRFSSNSELITGNDAQDLIKSANSKEPGGVPNRSFPKGGARSADSTISTANKVPNVSADSLASEFAKPENASARDSLATRATKTGMTDTTYEEYQAMDPAEKAALQDEVIAQAASGNKKMQQFASQSLAGSKAAGSSTNSGNYPTGAGEPLSTAADRERTNVIASTTGTSSTDGTARGATEEELAWDKASRVSTIYGDLSEDEIRNHPTMKTSLKRKALNKIQMQKERHISQYGQSNSVDNQILQKDKELGRIEFNISDTERTIKTGNVSASEKEKLESENRARREEYYKVLAEKKELEAQKKEQES